jgi:hypothetical protein
LKIQRILPFLRKRVYLIRADVFRCRIINRLLFLLQLQNAGIRTYSEFYVNPSYLLILFLVEHLTAQSLSRKGKIRKMAFTQNIEQLQITERNFS